MREPMRLYGVEPLEIKQWFEQTFAGRIAVKHRDNVGPETRANCLVAGDRLAKQIIDEISWNNLIAEPRRDPVNDRVLEGQAVQNRINENGRQGALARERVFGLLPQPCPKGRGQIRLSLRGLKWFEVG